MMCPLPAPITRARSTNARSFSESVWDRMIRAVDDQLVIPMTITMTIRVIRIPNTSVAAGADEVADDRRQDQGQDERRDHEEEVGDPHQEGVEPAADEAGDDPDDGADRDRDDRRQQADEQRDPGAVDGQVEHVAAQLVGAERVARRPGGWRRPPVAVTAVWSGPTMSCGSDREDREDQEDRRAPIRPSGRRRSGGNSAPAPANAPDAARRPCSGSTRQSCPDPRVEGAVDEVGHEVRQHDRHAEEQEDALEDRVVAGVSASTDSVPSPGQLNTTSTVIAPATT